MQELVSESLQLVGEELLVTFDDVRTTLEQYADGGASPRSIERCVKLLHAANGALRLTETYGASLLAEEMEGTCHHLSKLSADDSRSDEALEALSRAAIQLPAYVDLIINGGRDIPLVLLPLLNDLRAARGRPLLSESTLLLLNIGSADGQRRELETRVASGENIVELCKSARPRFQLALLGWIRGDNTDSNLQKIAEVAERLENAAVTGEAHQLWWVVGGVIEALLEGGLETSVALKRLMGQVDREMKRLPLLGEDKYAENSPTDLVNNLLYYIARSTKTGQRGGAIRAAFNLSDLIPGDDQVEIAREGLAAPSAKLMTTVAQAIREDLARVKDVLDIYLRTGMQHVEELTPQIELLKKIGDTMGVLGLGDLRETIQLKRRDLQEIIDSGQPVSEEVLLDMAAALLHVENHLDEKLFDLIRPDWAAPVGAADEPIDAEFNQVAQAVMRECVINLARVKDAVAQVLDRPGEAALLDTVPRQLSGIMAGLMILEKEEVVSVVEEIGSLIGELIQHGYTGVSSQQLDLLADAIVSLEYYMETLQSGRKEPVYMLDNARKCLKALRETDISALPKIRDDEVSSLTTTMQMPDYTATLLAAQTQVIPDLSAGTSGEKERVDPELIELFIEEAGEEVHSIRKHFPVWQDDESQHKLLNQIRRSFHTLKGSGRMVGAEVIGEFCWAVEDLLNRLINGTLKRTPSIVDCVRQAAEALPELLEQFEAGTAPETDLEAIMRSAGELAKGPAEADQEERDADATFAAMLGIDVEVIDPGVIDTGVIDPGMTDFGTIDPGTMGEGQAETVVRSGQEPEATDLPPAIDPVLLDILSKETGTHLDAITAFIATTTDSVAPFMVDEDLHRACHTLHGSVTMANAVAAAAVTGPLNQMIRRAYDYEQPIDESAVTACADTVKVIALIIDCLQQGDGALPDTTELCARLGSIDADLKAQIALAAVKADETIPPKTIVTEAPATEPDFDPEIAVIFSEEAAEILEGIDAQLEQATDNELGGPALAELQRYLHTLKGGARLTGLLAMGDLSHDLETLLVRIDSGQLEQNAERFDVLRATIDELHHMRDQLVLGQIEATPPALVARLYAALADTPAVRSSDPALDTEVPATESAGDELLSADELDLVSDDDETELQTPVDEMDAVDEEGQAIAEEAAEEEAETEAEAEAEKEESSLLPASEQLGELARELEAPAIPEIGDLAELVQQVPEMRVPERRDFARVDPELLENLLNNAGEVSIFHSRLSQQMGQIQFNLVELGQTVVRLRDQLRNLEMATEAQIIYRHHLDSGDDNVDPLTLERYSKIQQLSRSLAETANDVSSLKDLLQNQASDTEALLVQQARTAAELQEGLMRTRMVGFQQQGARLARLVRQITAEHGKQAELLLHGGGEIDRQVLEKMLPPLEHMIRNAIIHGIESPDEREAAGKPAVGRITITLRREGAQIVIEVADDGRGMHADEILRKAIELGMAEPDVDLSSDEILQFVLKPGFSTADRLSHAAGRGVGMDVVVSEITKLDGTLHLDTQPGEGSTFSVRLPFTLAVTQALIVRVAHELFALPLPTIEGIIRISRNEFAAKLAAEAPVIEYGGREYQFRHLGQYLGLGPAHLAEDEARVSIILARSGQYLTALVADEMLDSREIVVKPVGGQLAAIQGISGATILGDGRIVVILDINSLVRAAPKPIEPGEIQAEPVPETALALVVDDSITMRRVTQRLLERHGMRVITAKDGIEAIGVLREHTPDIILLDVEMPRMDGYEFASHVRNDPEIASLPIIMITSRVSDKHKARAIELGVNDYLGKPYQESKLMAAVNHLLNQD